MRSRGQSRARTGQQTLEQAIRYAIFGANGGAWLDPSDLHTLYQDSAGTTPVTAFAQPVGLSKDKGGANNVLQATAAARPTWSALVNALTYSQDFTNAAWSLFSITSGIADNGMSLLTTTATSNAIARHAISVAPSTQYNFSFYAKRGSLTTNNYAVYDVTNSAFIVPPTSYYAQINALGETRITVVFTAPATCTSVWVYVAVENSPVGNFYVGRAQVAFGSTASRYQRVGAATDYDTIGFPSYLEFAGIDDSLASATGGGGTAGFFFCAAIQREGGAGTLQTLWSDNGTNTGYKVQLDVNNKLSFSAGNGTAFTTLVSTPTVDVGALSLLTVWDDGVNLNAQIGYGAVVSVARPVVAAGTAGFTDCKDNGAASSFFIGDIYQRVYIKNSGLTAAQRSLVQSYVRSKAGL